MALANRDWIDIDAAARHLLNETEPRGLSKLDFSKLNDLGASSRGDLDALRRDVKAAESHLMKFLSVDGVTGEEAAIAAAVSDELKRVAVPASSIRFDDENKRIPLPTQTGNLIVDLPGLGFDAIR